MRKGLSGNTGDFTAGKVEELERKARFLRARHAKMRPKNENIDCYFPVFSLFHGLG
jgi:hypothetical protein